MKEIYVYDKETVEIVWKLYYYSYGVLLIVCLLIVFNSDKILKE